MEEINEKKNVFKENLSFGIQNRTEQAEFVKRYREKHGLDEYGYSLDKKFKRPKGGYQRERGDDDLRSRWADADDDMDNEDN